MLARWPTFLHSILNMFCMKADFVDPLFCVITYIWPVFWLRYFNILLAMFQLCSQNLNTGQVFWNVLSVTVVTVTVMTKYENMTHEPPIAHCQPECQTWIHSLLSCQAPLCFMIGLNLDNVSYLCSEPLFPGAVHKNANFRNLRWEHHFVFKEWSMSRDHCLLSPGNGSLLFFEMCRHASRMTAGSVTWCVMRGSGEALEISSRALSAPIISLAPHPLTVLTPGLASREPRPASVIYTLSGSN